MLTLRLARAGTKKKPVYHVMAKDSRSRRDGRFIENLGYYIPSRKILVLKQDRVKHWLSLGAQCSDTVRELIQRFDRHQGFGASPAPQAGLSSAATEAAKAPAAAPTTHVVVVHTSEEASA